MPLRLVLALILLVIGCSGPDLRDERVIENVAPLATDRHLEVARRYAPAVFHAVHPELGRMDLPTRVDFDGNLRGDDNWDHFAGHALPPVVYYAALETATHWFLSYHLFHPRDHSCVRLGIHEEHENDGENLQVVVSKATGRPALLFTQAHYFGVAWADPAAGFEGGEEPIAGPIVLCDDQGRPDPRGTHAAVFVEAYGHGILGAADPAAPLDRSRGRLAFAEGTTGLLLLPAAAGAGPQPEPALDAGTARYRLASTLALWPGVRDGTLVGEGGLFDGPTRYRGPRRDVTLPRFYEANRFSGPFGPDRGISPFALDWSFLDGDQLGALFFDPALRWKQSVRVPAPWSLDYVDDPFRAPAR